MKHSYREHDLHVLRELGLTPLEAEVYIAFVKSGESTVSSMAQTLQKARAEVYRALPKLQKLGLIEKITSIPNKYRAFSISMGLNILLEHNTKKQHEIQTEAKNFLKKFKERTLGETYLEDADGLVIAHGWEVEKTKVINLLESVQTSFDGIVPAFRLRIAFDELLEFFEKALRRGIKLRHITNLPEDKSIQKAIQILKKAGDYEIRYIPKPPRTIVGITDKKALHLTYMLSGNQVRSLVTTSPDLVETFQDYFDLKWRSALRRKKQTEKDCLPEDRQRSEK
jgi:sugar-specific transcriptional regulator TrmB